MKIPKFVFLTLCVAASSLSAAEQSAQPKPKEKKPEAPTFLTVETAGLDYPDQGEYSNDWGGAQVIALGDSRFRLVIYQGGLPGAGWDQTAATKTALEGKREGDKIVFTPGANGFKHSLAKDVLTTLNPNGDEYTMKKTERSSP